jgi:hypothetical protein
MIILLPIFSLPQPGIHSEKLCRLVRQYAEIAEGQLVVCTDKQEVLESVRNLKISCFRSDAPCLQDQTSIFPIGTGESLRCLEQQVPQLAADPVIALINYRAPVIPAKILSQA